MMLAALFAAGCCCGNKYQTVVEVIDEAQPPAPLQPPVPPVDEHTRLVMKHVYLRQADTFFLDVRHLLGEMVPTGKGGVVVFGDAKSYEVHVQDAEVAMSAESLTGLLNNHVFAYQGAPLKKMRVTMTPDGKLKQEGVMHWAHLRKQGFDVPFTIIADVQPTREGLLRLHPVKVEVCDVNGKPLMDLLHIKLEKILDLSGAQGLRVEGNDLILDPGKALPPPRIVGRLEKVRIEGDQLVQEIGPASGKTIAAPPPPPDRDVANYMHLYGGTVRFGRLFMVGTNLQIADAHPQDPFEFYLQYYDNQLAAGYSRSHLDDSLTTYMPDFWMVGKTLQPSERIAVGQH
ncbi:MAG TPA: hypothetical protein VGS57_16400 [Thermoanaerobaculia bacterium]|nr:hypothetical protein [Thermoanaerobaculia bacterium]